MKKSTLLFSLVFYSVSIATTFAQNSTIDFVTGSQHTFFLRGSEIQDSNSPLRLNYKVGFNYSRQLAEKIHLKTVLRYRSLG